MTPLRFRPEVVADLAEAWDWYEGRCSGLGDEFLAAVERCNEGISSNPALFATVHRSVRRALLGRFPFAVFFVVGDDAVTVLAVLHARRDPSVWQKRT